MRKKEYQFWIKALDYKRLKHILDVIETEKKDSMFISQFKEQLDNIEKELYDYVVDNNYPLRNIPHYLDSLREEIIKLNRKTDKKEIEHINRK